MPILLLAQEGLVTAFSTLANGLHGRDAALRLFNDPCIDENTCAESNCANAESNCTKHNCGSDQLRYNFKKLIHFEPLISR